MTDTALAIVSGVLGGIAGVIGTLVGARKSWFSTSIERRKASDEQVDRLIIQIKETYEYALKAATAEHEIKLLEAKSQIRAEVMTELTAHFDALFNVYGCDNAPGCENHVPRKKSVPIGL